MDFLVGRCVGCGVPCYIECARCYTLLQAQGQPHSCSSPSDEGFIEPDIEVCDECDDFSLGEGEEGYELN